MVNPPLVEMLMELFYSSPQGINFVLYPPGQYNQIINMFFIQDIRCYRILWYYFPEVSHELTIDQTIITIRKIHQYSTAFQHDETSPLVDDRGVPNEPYVTIDLADPDSIKTLIRLINDTSTAC